MVLFIHKDNIFIICYLYFSILNCTCIRFCFRADFKIGKVAWILNRLEFKIIIFIENIFKKCRL